MLPTRRPRYISLLLLLLPLLHQVTAAEDELAILLKFRQGIVDPLGHLSNWLPKSGSQLHCSWSGISCNSAGSVVGLDLHSRNLSGYVSSLICELSSLVSISLSDNNFSQPFPVGLLNCNGLRFLDLGYNGFFGQLPSNVSLLSSLEYLDLQYNDFSGPIPAAIGDLSELWYLNVWSCFFVDIPPQLGNLTKLTNLTLSYNPFTSGLPPELRRLTSLQSFKCGGCQLTGSVPPWLGELKALDFLELTWNSLTGPIPASIMQLPKLTFLELYGNGLTGPIPPEIENLVSLTDLDLNSNLLNGSIPDGLASLPNLRLLHLWNNSLTGEIPKSLASLRSLYDASLFMNQLTGDIPAELGLHTSLEIFDVSTNLLSGPVPTGLCTGGRLRKLILFNNSFSGRLPDEYGQCTSLLRVRVYHNSLSGPVPSGIWGLPLMSILELYDNVFEAEVPSQLGQATSLSILRIHNNRLTGSLPEEIGKLQSLDEFSAYGNKFSGPLPRGLTKCSALTKLLLANNTLEGEIPSEIGRLSHLAFLDLSHNRLAGSIPPSISNLDSLISLDLSSNDLSGSLPQDLMRLRLKDFLVFNLSNNELSGTLPPGMDASMFSLDLVGNPKLCVSAGRDCSISRSHRRPGSVAWVAGAVLVSAAAASALCSFYFYKVCHRPSAKSEQFKDSAWNMIPFQKVSFTLEDVLCGLDEDNVIGTGGAGKVYKVALSNSVKGQHNYLAVKKVWSCSGKDDSLNDYGFRTEAEILGRIRHLNIVRLLCCCSNGDVNLLVYEYVPNGSLGDILHNSSTKVSGVLDWPTRYKIALGAAQGLSYLHHDCIPQIIHRDIKSNNILLSDQYDALLADFGLAKLVESSPTAAEDFSISVLAGSHGYIAPEYAHRLKVNEKSDVYSFGVVLLELVTGRRPIGSSDFGDDGVDIVGWACKSIQSSGGVSSVLDPRLASSDGTAMLLLLKIALRCTGSQPSSRPSMREVVQMIVEADPGSNSSKPKI